ncbi:MAG: MotE family protein [Bacteriovoracia bacterium]
MRVIRITFHSFCALLFMLAVLSTISKAKAEEEQQAEDKAYLKLLREVDKKRDELDAKDRELKDREKRIEAREQEFDRKLKEMERLRLEISGELEGQRKKNEEKVGKLVTVLETMSPKSASGVLENLDEWLAVEVLKRMDSKRLAKIMNIMDKAKTAKLSELLTGYVSPNSVEQTAGQVHAANGVKEPNQQKGGEKEKTDEHIGNVKP